LALISQHRSGKNNAMDLLFISDEAENINDKIEAKSIGWSS